MGGNQWNYWLAFISIGFIFFSRLFSLSLSPPTSQPISFRYQSRLPCRTSPFSLASLLMQPPTHFLSPSLLVSLSLYHSLSLVYTFSLRPSFPLSFSSHLLSLFDRNTHTQQKRSKDGGWQCVSRAVTLTTLDLPTRNLQPTLFKQNVSRVCRIARYLDKPRTLKNIHFNQQHFCWSRIVFYCYLLFLFKSGVFFTDFNQ